MCQPAFNLPLFFINNIKESNESKIIGDLHFIPDDIFKLKELTGLVLNNTRKPSKDHEFIIPEELGTLTKLETLTLPNCIRAIPSSAENLSNLKNITFEDLK